MTKARSLVGPDVHATKIVAAVLDAETGQLQTFSMSGENQKAAAFCAGLPRPVRVAYEAGPTGYGLARELAKRGLECVVAAPSKIPRASDDRVKTDRRDDEHLVRLLLAGKLHPVRVTPRHPVRRRPRVDGDHCDWLATVELSWSAAQATLLDARGAIDAPAHRPTRSSARSWRCSRPSPWTVQAGRLRSLRGIDTLTAVALCTEVGDFELFATAEQLMSYIGLVPSESTTGQQRRLGAITKTGSGHARRLLVEAAWHYRSRPKIGRALAERQDSQQPEAIAVAWSAQRRLHRTWTRLETRAKRRTIIAVAAARELAGFVWAITQIE